MFCTKCGANLEDGAKFCTSCGTPTRFAQVPVPETAAPAAPEVPAAPEIPATPAAEWTAPAVPATPAAPAAEWPTPAAPAAPTATPAAPAQPAWTAPAAPAQPTQPAQPAQPAQNVWTAPAQPAAPAQPQQWSQPAQQPQWPQQPQQSAPPQWTQQQAQQWQRQQQQTWPQAQQQPAQQWQAQPAPQQPAYGGAAPRAKAKKGGTGVIIGIIAVVLALVIGVGGFVWPGFFKKGKDGGSGDVGSSASSGSGSGISQSFAKKATPEELFEAVENNTAADLSHHIASIYDNLFLSNATNEDISASGKLSLEPGDKLRELVTDALGEYLEQINPGDDLSWLKGISAAYDVSRKGDLMGFNAGVALNGTDIIHAVGTLQEGGAFTLSVPELSDRAFSVPLEDMDLSSINLGSNAILGSLLESLDIENAENLDLDAISKALPDAGTVEKLLNKYLTEAIGLVEKVERGEGTLSVAEVSAEYTVLTSTLDKATMQAIVDKLAPEIKADPEIKKILVDILNAAGEDGEAKYAELMGKLDSKLQEYVDGMETDTVITVYLDKKTSEVHGRIIDAGDQKLEVLMPENGGSFGLLVRFTDETGEKLNLMGSGKRSGDKLTGDLDLQVDGEYYGVVGLDGFDVEKAKDGSFVGGVNLKPSASFWKLVLDKVEESELDIEIPESLRSILDTMEFHVDLDTSKDKAAISVTATNGADKFFTLAFDTAKGKAKAITPAEGVEASEWAGDITLDKLEKVVAAIERAGVPTAYTDLLDEALDSAFN